MPKGVLPPEIIGGEYGLTLDQLLLPHSIP